MAWPRKEENTIHKQGPGLSAFHVYVYVYMENAAFSPSSEWTLFPKTQPGCD